MRHAPTLNRPRWAMHYLQLVSTTGVSAGMIAMDAVLGDWPGDNAQLQPCYYVLDGLPYAHIMCVSQGLECGSMAAAPAVLMIRRVVHRYPSWSRECWMRLFRSSSRSGINAIPACRRVVAPGSCLCTSGHGQHLTAVEMMPARELPARATDERAGGARSQGNAYVAYLESSNLSFP
ncbi:MAG: hypothetical protein KatS3mg056_0398 [Chloroflexus sp.]|nr:MAG: hypothetical protein KatS3mg056_0398 [Chloroflexus sp.]